MSRAQSCKPCGSEESGRINEAGWCHRPDVPSNWLTSDFKGAGSTEDWDAWLRNLWNWKGGKTSTSLPLTLFEVEELRKLEKKEEKIQRVVLLFVCRILACFSPPSAVVRHKNGLMFRTSAAVTCPASVTNSPTVQVQNSIHQEYKWFQILMSEKGFCRHL